MEQNINEAEKEPDKIGFSVIIFFIWVSFIVVMLIK
jgi:cytochrome c1